MSFSNMGVLFMRKDSSKRVYLSEYKRRIIIKNELTSEMLKRLKAAKTVFELFSIAKENGTELTQEDAEAYYASLNQSDALSDDQLDRVSGGIVMNATNRTNLRRSKGVCGALACPYCSCICDSESIEFHIQSVHPEKYSEYMG